MELIRSWLIGITCAAIVVAVADSLMPTGAVKKLGKLTGGLVLMLAVIQPLAGLDYDTMAMAITEYSLEQEPDLELGAELSDQMMKNIIADRTGAYILDKAQLLGISCQVEVTCETGEEGIPYPTAVTITGVLEPEAQTALSRAIEGELAIPVGQHSYRDTESGDVE